MATQINISKCVYVRFGIAHRPTFPYCIKNVLLHEALCTKDLGVIFNSKLVFYEHCNAIANKGFARANMLLRFFHSRGRTLQMKLFNTLCVRFSNIIPQYGHLAYSKI